MGKCKHLIDISPYDPLCDHPCRLYGGGAVEAECETCQYHIEDLERENAKLRDELDLCLKCEECEAMLDCDECLRVDASQKERKRLDYENAKLRELVARLICHIENPPCESCMMEMSCAGGEGLTNCDEYQFMVYDARKLGVEV